MPKLRNFASAPTGMNMRSASASVNRLAQATHLTRCQSFDSVPSISGQVHQVKVGQVPLTRHRPPGPAMVLRLDGMMRPRRHFENGWQTKGEQNSVFLDRGP